MDIPTKNKFKEPLALYTTFKVGGEADIALFPNTVDEFSAALKWTEEHSLPLTVLGAGSNVLVSDYGVEGVVIITTGMKDICIEGNVVSALAGATMNELCERCADNGLSGFEFFYGLPGTVGGALFMNARCYDKSISDFLLMVEAVDLQGNVMRMSKEECNFDYKSSIFQQGKIFVVSASFRLEKVKDADKIKNQMNFYKKLRKSSGQYLWPNAGCIFKNDRKAGKPSGQIIEECGLKGTRYGGAVVSVHHANFIVNTGNATAQEIYELMKVVEQKVLDMAGIKLEREVRLIGRWSGSAGVK